MALLLSLFRSGIVIAIVLGMNFVLSYLLLRPRFSTPCSNPEGILPAFVRSTQHVQADTQTGVRLDQTHLPTTTTTKALLHNLKKGVNGEYAVNNLESRKAVTGSVFHGKKMRHFTGTGWRNIRIQKTAAHYSRCAKWNVVTTIFAPSEAVKRAAAQPGWCTVIVADLQTPNDYLSKGGFEGNEKVHFLSVEQQRLWAQEGGAVGEFVRILPYNHFVRKNLGYLYAIQRGAEFVFDFDDDNLLDKGREDQVLTALPNETYLEGVKVVVLGKSVLNHHPLMGASLPGSWPRGLPLESVQDVTTQGKLAYENVSKRMDSIAVMQLLADVNPDIDAIHRLVKPLPMTFRRASHVRLPRTSGAMIVPCHAMIPYNAQATIHTAKALWAILLPYTVHGRVSDIWRGYFSQALFRALGLSVAVLPPLVTQDRNEHDYLADMDAELDLYFKAGKLVEFLNKWHHTLPERADSIPDRMEQLWIELYERGYIEINDVRLVQLWLAALEESGYDFPNPVSSHQRRDNIVLMGQFNYRMAVTSVIFWTQKWRTQFRTVVVRGPFSDAQIKELNRNGVMAYSARRDRGYYSPMENLLKTLKQYQSDSDIDAVLYVHDDALLNVTEVLRGYSSIPPNLVMVAHQKFGPKSREAARKVLLSKSYSLHPNGWFSKLDGTYTNSSEWLKSTLNKWWFMTHCMDSFRAVYNDPKTREYHYLEENDRFFVPPHEQSDFMLVPTALTEDYSRAAQLMLDHKVFLECAFPKILDILTRTKNIETRIVSLCTDWPANKTLPNGKLSKKWIGIRGLPNMLEKCKSFPRTTFGMFHPYKLNRYGKQNWSSTFDWITYGERPIVAL